MKHMNIVQFNSWAKTNIVDENKFDEIGFIIIENSKNYKSTGVIAKVFNDHWDEFFSNCKNTLSLYRPNADKEVHKMIDCSKHNLGTSIIFALMIIKFIFVIILIKANYVLLVILNHKLRLLKIF